MAHIVILGMSGMTIAIHASIFPTIMFWLLTMAPLTMHKSPCRQSVASTKWKQECRLHVVIAEAPSRWPSSVIWVEREQLIKKTSNSSNCVQDILIHCKMLVPFCYWMLLNDALPYVQKVSCLVGLWHVSRHSTKPSQACHINVVSAVSHKHFPIYIAIWPWAALQAKSRHLPKRSRRQRRTALEFFDLCALWLWNVEIVYMRLPSNKAPPNPVVYIIFLIIRWFILGDVRQFHVWNSMFSMFLVYRS